MRWSSGDGISFLKAGINFSERLTTVSPTYAREIVTPELGFGFDGVIARRAGSLVGILNGIDTDRWNPASDSFLPRPYSADEPSGKAESKRALLKAVSLPITDDTLGRPLIGLVSRLTDQKGFDLIAAVLRRADDAGCDLGHARERRTPVRGSVDALSPPHTRTGSRRRSASTIDSSISSRRGPTCS